MANNIVRKVILFNGKDIILDYFQIGKTILPDTEIGKRLVNRLCAVANVDKDQARACIDTLAHKGIVRAAGVGVLSTEDGVLYFHLINEDSMCLDPLHNFTTQEAIMEALREFAKSDHDESYVDCLSDEQVCRNWHFKMIVTERTIEGDNMTLEEIEATQPIGIIYDNRDCSML